MMLLQSILRRLDRVQTTLWFRVAATVLVLGACAAYFGPLANRAVSLDAQRHALIEALTGQNVNNKDEHAVSLKETGTVHLRGRTYGSADFANPRASWFGENGEIASPARLAVALLQEQIPTWAPTWMLEEPGTAIMLSVTITLWLVLIVWMGLSLHFVLTILGTGMAAGLLWWMDRPQAVLAAAGIGVLVFTFVLLTRLALLLLNRPNQVLAVAHTMVKEASRTRIALAFIVILLIALPLIPMWLDPGSPLRFRVQTFISRSLSATFALTACMTLVLSCASVAFEIRDRQIWQLMTKPLNRLSYLAGKWLGVMVVNLIIITVAGLSTFAYVQYMKTLPVAPGEAGMLDRLAVMDEILTARLASQPTYEALTDEQVRERAQQRVDADARFAGDAEPTRAELRKIEQEIRQEFSAGQRSIPPGQRRVYTFHGLGPAKKLNSTLTLRYRFHILEDSEHDTFPAVFEFLDTQNQPITGREIRYVPTMAHSAPLGVDVIQDDGTLRIAIINMLPPDAGVIETRGTGSMNFETKDFEVLYKVGGFEANFARAMIMTWVKLAFLAAAGTAFATFLSFPVACLASFTVFLAGVLSPFLSIALYWYIPPEASAVDWSNIGLALQWIFERTTSWIGEGLVYVLGGFGEFRPTQQLVEGKLIEWKTVGQAVFKLGLLWSGVALFVGFLVLRQRQLAIYSGQG